jgi:hypothetical protein
LAGRTVARCFFWTFDDCFLRLAMIDPVWLALRKRIDARLKDNSRRVGAIHLSTDFLTCGTMRTMANPAKSPHNQFYHLGLSRSGLRLRFHRKAK